MRFSENTETDHEELEFTPRDTKSGMVQLVLVYVIATIVIVALALNVGLLGGGLFSLLVTLLLCGLAFYTVLIRQNNVDLVMTTEFQNLIFASAASHGSDFTMFLKVDGSILYANEGLRNMFPQFAMDEGAALDNLLEAGRVAPSDREKMFSALVSGKGEKLIFAINDQMGNEKQYIVSIQPLRRPPGVFVVRGREYIVSRAAAGAQKPKEFKNTSLHHLDQALAGLPFGVYIIGTDGIIEFANSHLEAALGYSSGELSETELHIDKLIFRPDEKVPQAFNPQAFKGEVMLLRANGALLRAQIDQRLLASEAGEISGVSATVIFE